MVLKVLDGNIEGLSSGDNAAEAEASRTVPTGNLLSFDEPTSSFKNLALKDSSQNSQVLMIRHLARAKALRSNTWPIATSILWGIQSWAISGCSICRTAHHRRRAHAVPFATGSFLESIRGRVTKSTVEQVNALATRPLICLSSCCRVKARPHSLRK